MGNHKYTIHKSSDNALQEPRDFVRLVEVTTWGRGEKYRQCQLISNCMLHIHYGSLVDKHPHNILDPPLKSFPIL